MFLQTPYLGASLHKGLTRVLGSLVGALLVLVLLAFPIQDRWALIGALSAVVAVSIYMIRNSRYGDAWFMLAITAVIIAGDASLDPSMAFAKAVSRSSEAVVGILVVLVINGLLRPRTGGAIYDRVYCDALAGLAEQTDSGRRLVRCATVPRSSECGPRSGAESGRGERPAARDRLCIDRIDRACGGPCGCGRRPDRRALASGRRAGRGGPPSAWRAAGPQVTTSGLRAGCGPLPRRSRRSTGRRGGCPASK